MKIKLIRKSLKIYEIKSIMDGYKTYVSVNTYGIIVECSLFGWTDRVFKDIKDNLDETGRYKITLLK